MTPLDTELYPDAVSRHGKTSEAYRIARKALRDEWISGLTGAVLAAFIWFHLLFESSILFGSLIAILLVALAAWTATALVLVVARTSAAPAAGPPQQRDAALLLHCRAGRRHRLGRRDGDSHNPGCLPGPQGCAGRL